MPDPTPYSPQDFEVANGHRHAEGTCGTCAATEAALSRIKAHTEGLQARIEELNRIKAQTWTEYEMADAQWTFTFRIHRDDSEDVLAHELAHAVQRFRWPDDDVHSERHARIADSLRSLLATTDSGETPIAMPDNFYGAGQGPPSADTPSEVCPSCGYREQGLSGWCQVCDAEKSAGGLKGRTPSSKEDEVRHIKRDEWFVASQKKREDRSA